MGYEKRGHSFAIVRNELLVYTEEKIARAMVPRQSVQPSDIELAVRSASLVDKSIAVG
jgi:hypothetical protein